MTQDARIHVSRGSGNTGCPSHLASSFGPVRRSNEPHVIDRIPQRAGENRQRQTTDTRAKQRIGPRADQDARLPHCPPDHARGHLCGSRKDRQRVHVSVAQAALRVSMSRSRQRAHTKIRRDARSAAHSPGDRCGYMLYRAPISVRRLTLARAFVKIRQFDLQRAYSHYANSIVQARLQASLEPFETWRVT